MSSACVLHRYRAPPRPCPGVRPAAACAVRTAPQRKAPYDPPPRTDSKLTARLFATPVQLTPPARDRPKIRDSLKFEKWSAFGAEGVGRGNGVFSDWYYRSSCVF